MIEQYLIGSIGQSLERVRQLRQIVQDSYRREYDGLRQICLSRLDTIQDALQRLARETLVSPTLQTPRRVREFKRIVTDINEVEGVGVFALSRMSQDDNFLNRFITEICREISYPLVSPTISHISQDYFHTYIDFNLLCVPLTESRFLLHLPDIYHEFCHLFHRQQNAGLPRLEAYHAAYKSSLFDMVKHFRSAITAAERVRSPTGTRYHLQLWKTCWVKFWMQEFFCDLFGVLMAGPAFAWSHYHLCVKRGGNPFETPLMFESTHPADDARMGAVLAMLAATGFEEEGKLVEKAWQDFAEVMDYRPTADYRQCYPENLIRRIVSAVKEGVESIGLVAGKPGSRHPIVGLLNSAWQEFWRAPENYQAWEAEQLNTLRASLHPLG